MEKAVMLFCSIMLLTLSACSGVDSKALDAKIENEGVEGLYSQEEYAFMISELESVYAEVKKAVDEGRGDDMSILDNSGHAFAYMIILEDANDKKKLDSDNKKAFDKMKKYVDEVVGSFASEGI